MLKIYYWLMNGFRIWIGWAEMKTGVFQDDINRSMRDGNRYNLLNDS